MKRHIYLLYQSLEKKEGLLDKELTQIFTKYKTIAIVGLSRDPTKDSYRVAQYLKTHGFHIIPVNPTAEEILEEKCYKSLLDVPVNIQKTIEIVDIFRPSNEVSQIVEQAIRLKKMHGVLAIVWMQLGIINKEAAEMAKKAGLTVVIDKCMMQEHRRLFSKT